MTFADMLDERGIRQSQIARAAGLTRQRVNEWVRGVRDPRLMALGTAR
ncbi:helix-turn-helix domain-containing protein, partial [Bifidobacterium bifidum]